MPAPVLAPAQLGRVLQSARKAKGWSQADLGALVGLSQKRISAIELDPARVTAEQLLKLCGALGLELAIGDKPPAARPATGARGTRKVEW